MLKNYSANQRSATLLALTFICCGCQANTSQEINNKKDSQINKRVNEILCIWGDPGWHALTAHAYNLSNGEIYGRLNNNIKKGIPIGTTGTLESVKSERFKDFSESLKTLQAQESPHLAKYERGGETYIKANNLFLRSTTHVNEPGSQRVLVSDATTKIDLSTFAVTRNVTKNIKVDGFSVEIGPKPRCRPINYPFARSPKDFANYLENYYDQQKPNITHSFQRLYNCSDEAKAPFSRTYTCQNGDLELKSLLGTEKCLVSEVRYRMTFFGNPKDAWRIAKKSYANFKTEKPYEKTTFKRDNCRWSN